MRFNILVASLLVIYAAGLVIPADTSDNVDILVREPFLDKFFRRQVYRVNSHGKNFSVKFSRVLLPESNADFGISFDSGLHR
jgi:hypothetical protein